MVLLLLTAAILSYREDEEGAGFLSRHRSPTPVGERHVEDIGFPGSIAWWCKNRFPVSVSFSFPILERIALFAHEMHVEQLDFVLYASLLDHLRPILSGQF